MIDFARVQKELVECRKDAEGSGIQVAPKSDNLVNLIGTIPGPTGTPYEGGVFQIEINLPEGYPFEPPKMQFSTKVWYENYLKDYQTFVNTARYWTESFAKTSSRGVEDKVQKLVEMGFPEAQVRSILEAVGGDENLALERLL
ncbi:hypothetical protein TSUD_317930, partial [Trifolium subterraneum]